MREGKREMCTYCAKWFPVEQLQPIKGDDSPRLNRLYCDRCYPEVQAAHNSLPWIRKNW